MIKKNRAWKTDVNLSYPTGSTLREFFSVNYKNINRIKLRVCVKCCTWGTSYFEKDGTTIGSWWIMVNEFRVSVAPVLLPNWKSKETHKRWKKKLQRRNRLRSWRDLWAGERRNRHIPSRTKPARGNSRNFWLFTNPLKASALALAFTASLPKQKHSRAKSRQLRRLRGKSKPNFLSKR